MSYNPQLVKMGERARSAKRGSFGPAPARKNELWDKEAARLGVVSRLNSGRTRRVRPTLVVRCAHTGELRSSEKATQEQLAEYLVTRHANLLAVAAQKGIDLTNSDGRRWLARAKAGKNEVWVQKVCTLGKR